MNEIIIERWNSCVKKDDIVYHLGDVFMGTDKETALKMVQRLNGKIYLAYGNHDLDNRLKDMANLSNIVDIQMGYRLKYHKYSFCLTHYPTLCSNYDIDKPLKQRVISLCGHIHTNNKFDDMNKGLIYHCEMDAHNCKPISIEDILIDIKNFYSIEGRVQT